MAQSGSGSDAAGGSSADSLRYSKGPGYAGYAGPAARDVDARPRACGHGARLCIHPTGSDRSATRRDHYPRGRRCSPWWPTCGTPRPARWPPGGRHDPPGPLRPPTVSNWERGLRDEEPLPPHDAGDIRCIAAVVVRAGVAPRAPTGVSLDVDRSADARRHVDALTDRPRGRRGRRGRPGDHAPTSGSPRTRVYTTEGDACFNRPARGSSSRSRAGRCGSTPQRSATWRRPMPGAWSASTSARARA